MEAALDPNNILYGPFSPTPSEWQRPVRQSDGSVAYRNTATDPNGNPYEYWTSSPVRACTEAAEKKLFHRIDGPAYIEKTCRGALVSFTWWKEGQLHREDGPVQINYPGYGKNLPLSEIWMQHDKYEREDGPAVLNWYPNSRNLMHVEWHRLGRYHRTDGPALEEWYETGQLDAQVWFLHDEIHREDGPARLLYYPAPEWDASAGPEELAKYLQLEEWRQRGKRHREDGPAVTRISENGRKVRAWWVRDFALVHKDFDKWKASELPFMEWFRPKWLGEGN